MAAAFLDGWRRALAAAQEREGRAASLDGRTTLSDSLWRWRDAARLQRQALEVGRRAGRFHVGSWPARLVSGWLAQVLGRGQGRG
ncbi:MAG: hypothetical protein ACKPKO_18265, partial [Candidatus Fonsibacter sp.]